jgi:DNA end-binding protein Ku
MAARLVDSFAGEWKPEQYKDRYTANLMAIIQAKSKGGRPRLGAIGPAAPAGDVVDLMERLRASLGGKGDRRAPARAGGPTRARSKAPSSRPAQRGHRKPSRRRAA